ncbi:MAG: DNA primase [Clostridia bacterium]|nr:DNA primase [Clostridia bacterium]
MAVRLSDSWLDELRSKVSIVDVVSEYVSLNQKGTNFWGLCPFHGEKTASFKVDQDTQLFYCFGCHKGGNVIHFVMEIERMEFMQAVRLLADRAHMSLPEEGVYVNSVSREKRQRMYEANLAAAKFYHSHIWSAAGERQLEYLHSRGLDDRDIRKFGLGAAPSEWDALLKTLEAAGFERDILVQAGLAVSKNNKCFDMFRERVIFPIIDAQGNVLGFGGRALGDANPKYLNTPDTPVFNKRKGLYAMNFIKRERPLKRVVLVEGYMDVVSLRKYGVTGVVATLGTALTNEQANLLKRTADEVWLAYDGDAAGQKAILRGLDLLDAAGAKSRVIVFPDGQDPDDFIRQSGLDGFDGLTKLDPMVYRMDSACAGLDLTSEENRAECAKVCCNILKKVRSPVELEMYVERLSIKTGFSREALMREIGTAAVEPIKPVKRTAVAKKERFTNCEMAQRTLLALLAAKLIDRDVVAREDFDDEVYKAVAAKLLSGKSPADAIDELDGENRQLAAGAVSAQILPEQTRALGVAEDCLNTIRRFRAEREIEELTGRLRDAGVEERRDILRRIEQLNKC